MKYKQAFWILSVVILMSVAFKMVKAEDEKYRETKNGITVYEADEAAAFPGAKLALSSPDDDKCDTGLTKFTFKVKDFKLGDQTPDAGSRMCANSTKGQHIHFIMDNAPYVAQYQPEFEHRMTKGNHVLLAFLSRSYHESLKHKDTFILTQFNSGGDESKTDLKGPLLFYSRPKGNYVGDAEIKRVLLDFYLVNTDLSSTGNKVIATIDGNSFTLKKWKPYFIEGLKPGKHRVNLQLVDKNNKPIPGKFNNSGDREIELTLADPIKNMK